MADIAFYKIQFFRAERDNICVATTRKYRTGVSVTGIPTEYYYLTGTGFVDGTTLLSARKRVPETGMVSVGSPPPTEEPDMWHAGFLEFRNDPHIDEHTSDSSSEDSDDTPSTDTTFGETVTGLHPGWL